MTTPKETTQTIADILRHVARVRIDGGVVTVFSEEGSVYEITPAMVTLADGDHPGAEVHRISKGGRDGSFRAGLRNALLGHGIHTC